mgnify:CR=1 FL=1
MRMRSARASASLGRCGENFACDRPVDFDTDVTTVEVAGPSSQPTFTCVHPSDSEGESNARCAYLVAKPGTKPDEEATYDYEHKKDANSKPLVF